MVSEAAKRILDAGATKLRVNRSGMFQVLEFRVRRVKMGNIEFVELYTERVIGTTELIRLAKETGLPIEAEKTRVFPEGTGAKDFAGL